MAVAVITASLTERMFRTFLALDLGGTNLYVPLVILCALSPDYPHSPRDCPVDAFVRSSSSAITNSNSNRRSSKSLMRSRLAQRSIYSVRRFDRDRRHLTTSRPITLLICTPSQITWRLLWAALSTDLTAFQKKNASTLA